MLLFAGILSTLVLLQVSASWKRRYIIDDDDDDNTSFPSRPGVPSPYQVLGLADYEDPIQVTKTYQKSLINNPSRAFRVAYYEITKDLDGFFDGIVSEYAFAVHSKSIGLPQDEALNFLNFALAVETEQSKEIISTLASDEIYSHLQKAWERYLKVAVKQNNLFLVQMIIASGFDLNAIDEKGKTAIFYAFEEEICSALLSSHRVSTSIRDNLGNSLLHNAVNAEEAIFKILLDDAVESKINLNLQNRRGMTALSNAITLENFLNAKLLLDSGLVNPEIPDSGGNTSLHQCMIVDNAEEIISRLLSEFRMDPNKKNAKGLTALQYSVKKCNPAYLQILLKDSRTLLNVQFDNGDTVLHFICRKQIGPYSNDIFRLLFDAGIDVNLANNDGYLALHYAAMQGHSSFVKELLERGSDPFVEANNLSKDTPFSMAYLHERFNIIDMIAEKYSLPHLSSTIYNQENFLRKQTLFFSSIGPIYHLDNSIKVNVNRESVVRDAIEAFSNFPESTFNRSVEFTFIGENGQDYGGVRREFCALLVQDLFGPQSEYFEVIGREYTVHIRRRDQNEDKDSDYLAIGRILGHLLKSRTLFEVHFAMTLLKGILDQPTNIDDLADCSEEEMRAIKTLR